MAESTRTHACILMRLHVSDPTPPPKASTPDTPDFSPEAIVEALNEGDAGTVAEAREGVEPHAANALRDSCARC